MAVDKQYVTDQLAKLDSKRRLGVGKVLKQYDEILET